MPVRNKSASLRASILSLLLPSFNKALRRGSQTSTCCTWGWSRSYSQAAQVPSSQVTCSSPCSPWINCRMLLALVSTIDSITCLPLPFSTAITTASLCTSMPIYLISRLISVASLGERSLVSTESFPQGTVPCFPESSYLYLYPDVLLTFGSVLRFPIRAAVAERSPAQRSGAEAAPHQLIQPSQAGRSFRMH